MSENNRVAAAGGERYSMAQLLRIMQRLRDPEYGCAWDLKQDFHSILPSTLEECYELADAIEREDWPHVADELGDVLFQVIFHAQLGSERELFDFSTVVHALADKLIRRHPHVFAGGDIEGIVRSELDSETVKAQWEQIKQQERRDRDQHHALADVPLALPALPRAQKLQKRAAQVGFDWPDADPVLHKMDEELAELRAALAAADQSGVAEEIGDVLFTTVNLARKLRLDAEECLRAASAKFERRFARMEDAAGQQGTNLAQLDLAALEVLWQQAKAAR
jgi:ATP diphosphatase